MFLGKVWFWVTITVGEALWKCKMLAWGPGRFGSRARGPICSRLPVYNKLPGRSPSPLGAAGMEGGDLAKVPEFPVPGSLLQAGCHGFESRNCGVQEQMCRAVWPEINGCGLLIWLILGLFLMGLFLSLPLMSGCLPSFLTAFSVITANLSSLFSHLPSTFLLLICYGLGVYINGLVRSVC